MAERFYVNCPLAPGPVVLQGAQAHHLSTVCRLRPGDRVYLFNGDGREYPAEVTGVERRTVGLRVVEAESPARELGFRLEVAAPLPKSDRAQFLLEKLTEVGATAYVPLRTRRSVIHPSEMKLAKLERWVVEASKQCGRNVLLRVEPLSDWEDYCRRSDLPDRRILAHPGEATATWPGAQDVAVAVGPEGGLAEDEVASAREAGWRLVGLGPRTLRVETAAVVLAVMASSPGAAAP
jgi:16S rRNA (uracil1498-N3)-methyltransferase